MNRKKIEKIISCVVSGIYISNPFVVFASEDYTVTSVDVISESENVTISNEDVLVLPENSGDYSEENNEFSGSTTDDNGSDSKEDSSVPGCSEEFPDKENSDIEASGSDSNLSDSDNSETESNKDSISSDTDDDVSSKDFSEVTDKIVEPLTTTDRYSSPSVQSVGGEPLLKKPSIEYKDGKVKIVDNGIVLDECKISEKFYSSSNLAFNFSNPDWQVTGSGLQSKAIGNSSYTSNSFALDVKGKGKITISAKVSSESGYDFGRIYINGTEVFKQSGTTNSYQSVTYDLNSGINTIEFKYSKDSSTSKGSDAMFIKSIEFESIDFKETSDKVEYRINSGEWTEYSSEFSCTKGDIIETRSLYNSEFSDILYFDTNIADIKDANLLRELNKLLGKPEDNSILYAYEIATLSGSVYLDGKGITDLSGLEHAINITYLSLDGNNITDVTPISNLNKLEDLNINNNNIKDISPLLNMTNLVSLYLRDSKLCTIDEFLSFESMPKLERLGISVDAPSYDLTIGNSGHFANLTYLVLNKSSFKNVKILNSQNISYFSLGESNATSLTVSGSPKINTVDISKSNFDTVDIQGAEQSVGIIAGNNNIKSLNISNCIGVSNVLFPNSNIENITLSYIGGSPAINFNDSVLGSVVIGDMSISGSPNFANSKAELIKITNSNLGSLYCNKIDANEMYMNSVTISSSMYGNEANFNLLSMSDVRASGIYMNTSKIKELTIEKDIVCDSLDFGNLETESDFVLDNLSIKNIYFSNMKANSIQLTNLNYITSLYPGNLSTKKLVIDRCAQLSSLYLSSLTLDELQLTSLPAVSSFSLGNINVDVLNLGGYYKLDTMSLSNVSANSLEMNNMQLIKNFYLTNCNIPEISLDEFNSLKTLYVSSCTIDNLNLTFCPSLTDPSITGGQVKNISISGVMPSLNSLYIAGTKTETFSLSDCPKLDRLTLASAELSDISNIDAPSVTKLILSTNNIKDISHLSSFDKLSYVDVSNNNISDISVLGKIDTLTVDNIKAANQVVDALPVNSKDSRIDLEYKDVLDYDGSVVSIDKVSSNGIIESNKAIFEFQSAGEYDETVEFLSDKVDFSARLNQKIYVDDTAPTLEVELQNKNYTNSNIKLLVTATDDLTGIDYILLPNGELVYDSNCTFEVESNGNYEFEAVDLAGNSTKTSIEVSNIDKDLPIVESSVIYSNNKKEAIIQIKAFDELSGIENIVLPDGKIINGEEASIIVYENGTYNILVRDIAGNIETVSVDVKSIDKDFWQTILDGVVPDTSGERSLMTMLSATSIAIGMFLFNNKKRK